MKKLLGILVLGLLWCNVAHTNIILSKCYIAKWKYESKDKPEMIQKKFDDKKWEDQSWLIDLKNKTVNRVNIKSEELFKKNIKRTKEKEGWIGIHMQDVTKEMAEAEKLNKPRGVLVLEVVKLSPAEKAGIIAGDIILELDKKLIDKASKLKKIVNKKWQAGKTLPVKVWRNKKEIIKKIKVGDYYKNHPKETATLYIRYHVANYNITKIEKDKIKAIRKQSGESRTEITLDTKKNTTKLKLFSEKENVPWLIIEEKCE